MASSTAPTSSSSSLAAAEVSAARRLSNAVSRRLVGTAQAFSGAAGNTALRRLTLGNVVTSTVEGIGSFVGPALGGAVILTGGAGAVFFTGAAGFLWSTIAIARIRLPDEPREEGAAGRVLAELAEGFGVIGRDG